MEQRNTDEENGSNKGTMCRQSSGRWTPTTDQVRILKDLYYNNGLRSPTADQIQRISANLRQYGKIEGKNVFYWFQNHKARERQKKRFGAPTAGAPSPQVLPHPHRRHHVAPMQRALSCDRYNVNGPIFKNDQDCSFPNISYGVNIIPSGYFCGSYGSAGAVNSANGKMAHSFESVSMEKRFRECSISPSSQSLSSLESVDHCYYGKPFDFFGSASGDQKENPENIKTLALFPINPSEADDVTQRWYRSDQKSEGNGGVSHAASLELSLNSFAGVSPTD